MDCWTVIYCLTWGCQWPVCCTVWCHSGRLTEQVVGCFSIVGHRVTSLREIDWTSWNCSGNTSSQRPQAPWCEWLLL